MIRRLIPLAALALTATLLGTVTPAQAEPVEPVVIFEDDFDGPAGSAPNPEYWSDFGAAAYNPAAAFGYIRSGNNETLDGDGNLVIPATPTAGSAIRSRFGFRYGVMSAWIKLPEQTGYWPAFWSKNQPYDGSTVHPHGEVDTLEAYTTWTATKKLFHANAHVWTGDSATKYGAGDHLCGGMADTDLVGQFNKYSAKIEPWKITFYFNDVQCGQVFTKRDGAPWGWGPYVSRPNWMILDLAVGGGGQPALPTEPAQLLVDRVEVTTLPNSTVDSRPVWGLTR